MLLVPADAIGTIPFFCAGERARRASTRFFGRGRRARSAGSPPTTCSWGTVKGFTHSIPAVLESALRTSRRRIPRWFVGLPRTLRSRAGLA